MAARSIDINDENVQPERPNVLNGKPNDSDRCRFGFKNAPSMKKKANGTSPAVASARTPDTSGILPSPPQSQRSSLAPPPSVDLLALHDEHLGDSEGLASMLRKKTTSDKWEYKDRMKELEKINNEFKDTLCDQRKRCKALRDALLSAQDKVNTLLQDSTNSVHEAERAAELKRKAEEDRRKADEEKTKQEHKDQLLFVEKRAQKRESAHSQELQKLRSEHGEQLLAEKKRISQVEQEHGFQMQQLKAEHGEALAREQQRVQKLEGEHHQQLQKLQAEHNDQLQLEKERSQRQEREHGEQLQQAQRDHSEQQHADQQRIQQLESSHMEKINSLEREHFERVQQLNRELVEQKQSEQHRLEQTHAEELQLERQRYEQSQSDLAASKHSNAELRAALHSAESERDRLTTLVEESKAEVEARRETASQANATHQAHVKAHTELKCEHVKLQDIAEERQVQITALEGKLQEAERQLLSKEADFREQIRHEQQQKQKLEHAHNEQIQRLESEHGEQLRFKDQEMTKLQNFNSQQLQKLHSEHTEQLRLEQQRSQALEQTHGQQLQRVHTEHHEELKSEQRKAQQQADDLREQLRKQQSEQAEKIEQLHSKHGTLREQDQHRLEQMESSHSEQLQSNARLQAMLQSAENEQERLTGLLAESQANLSTQVATLREATISQQSLREELAAVRAALEAKNEQATSLLQEKRNLELEFGSYKEHHGSSNQQQMEAITELKLTVDKLTQKVDSTQMELGVQQGNMVQQQSYVKSLERQLSQAEKSRRDLHNAIQELKGNIRVFCRIRPVLPSAEIGLHCSDAANKLCLTYGGESYNFGFDNVFGMQTSQVEIFEEVTGLVQSALDGYKVCIFAYGQTGSGKTFTMQGTEERTNWGLIPRSLQQIFQASEAMRAQGWTWELQASFLEVYNETIRDLLRPSVPSSSTALDSGSASGQHVIKHDEAWGTMVTNITSVDVDSMEQINSLMARAAQQRAVGSTDMNAQSSRSHSVFALYLRGTNEDLDSELHGALHLVDLAGSERLSKSGATGDRLKETQNINKSLSSLADVFLAKAESRSHVPFRNSKLTHLMEPCLSGQGKTLMMVNVGPEEDNAHETLCSLRFASQVSQCDTGGKPKRTAKSVNQGNAQRRPQTLSSRPQSAASTSSSSAARRMR